MSHQLLDMQAELGSEEDDEDFDENASEPRPKKTNGTNGQFDDSSEEDEDLDDEARIRAEGAGWVVDDLEDEEEEVEHSSRRKKRRRKERERSEEALDEDDLDLIGARRPEPKEASQSKYKRLKRGHKGDRPAREHRGIEEIFSDDDDAVEDLDEGRRGPRSGLADEFADFIEEDQFEDELEDDRDVAQPGISLIARGLEAAGLTEGAEEDYRAAFGDGTDYDWAMDLQAQAQHQEEEGRELQLTDVFEPAQLEEKMLTEEDNIIRTIDVPERLQLARKPFKPLDLTEEQMEARLAEEAVWITQLIWPKKRLPRVFAEPFRKAVRQVLHFMVVEEYEVPFIFTHRKDYLIHTPDDRQLDGDDPDSADVDPRPERLLVQNDLWEILDLDLKFRALTEKRDALQQAYENVQRIAPHVEDAVLEELITKAVTIEEIQELQDYLHFQYSPEMKDLRLMESEANGTQKRAQTSRNFYDKIRAGNAYALVRAFGITADDFAQNCEEVAVGRRKYTEDPAERPDDLADSLIDPPEYSTGSEVLGSAKLMFIQELFTSPRLRRFLRGHFYAKGMVNCIRTSKGLRKITEDHPYYEFKYLRHLGFQAFSEHPDKFLKMLKAEEENLIEIKIEMNGFEEFKRKLYGHIVSDGISEVADSWNTLRREVLDKALDKLEASIAHGVKENLRTECEKELASRARENLYNKLDQAPYKPKGADLGAIPDVLVITNGAARRGDAICWVYQNSAGQVVDHGKFDDLRLGNRDRNIPDGKDIHAFCELIRNRRPDVVGVSGLCVETRKLLKDLQEIVEQNHLEGPDYNDEDDEDDEDDDRRKRAPLDVILVNDETARLYWLTPKADREFPHLGAMHRYCVGLARYMQNPLLEYASLGKDIVSIPLVQNQNLVPQEKLLERLETAMIDMVNLVGVELNDAFNDPYLAQVLQYVCGLGPRKASQLLKTIQVNGEQVLSRFDLIGVTQDHRELKQAIGPKVFQNAASFIYLRYDQGEETMDYLDNTRVHPEDYDLARKMVADALEMDEEDVKAETDEGGASAVVRKMIREDANDKVQDLILEEYATEIEKKLKHRKRATLETIRAELLNPYEEIRQAFSLMTTDEVFTMLTGETKESLSEGMVVPVKIKRTFPDHIEVKLDCGIEGGVSASEFPEGVGNGGMEPRSVYQIHQTVRARILFVNRKGLTAQLSLRDDLVRQPLRKDLDRNPGEWDERQEAEDKKAAEKEKETITGRAHRVVDHPFFFPWNSAQAEEYLGGKEPGSVVIRPSSKGLDHLAVTWKVADNTYQHVDVLELNKENEYSLGKKLRVNGEKKWEYSDLDELIVNHIQAMAKKVTEMMRDERFQKGSKESTDQWLKTYTEANPRRFMYAFCIMPKYPGYFWLCFRAGYNAEPGAWPVKVVPNAFELKRHAYPDMKALKNGFKLLASSGGAGGAAANPPPGRPGAMPMRR
jgi:transcription elongation factor SPT6